MAKIDTTKYNAQVANAAAQVKISSTVFKAFIADVKDVVDQNSPEGRYAADAGSTDDYAVTLAPVPTAYFIGMVVRFKANTANTGAATLNVNSLGAKTIVKSKDNTLEDSDIKAGQLVTVVYDGTNFQMESTPSTLSANRFQNSQAIIGGNFDVWQRGTSSTNPATASFLADRFLISYSYDSGTAPTNVIHSRQVLTSGDIPNTYYFYRIAPDGAGSSFGVNASYGIFQRIENGTRYLCGLGKKVNVSIWLRSSIAGKRVGVALSQQYGTGGSPSTQEALTGSIVTLTSTWTKYTFTFTTNTLVGKTFGTNNDDYLQVGIYEAWGTTTATTNFGGGTAESFVGAGNIDIAQVQLCAGDTASPFQPRSFAEELALCQRYYEKSYLSASAPGSVGAQGSVTYSTRVAIAASTAGSLSSFTPFRVTKRTIPTITLYSPTGTSGAVRVAFSTNRIGVTAHSGYLSESSFSLIAVDNTSTTVIALDNFIEYHWVAVAEL